MEDLQFSSTFENQLGRRTFRETYRGKPVAVKKFLIGRGEIVEQTEEYWTRLVKLRDDHLVQYHQVDNSTDTRLIVMDICQGSMLDYCRKTLDEKIGNAVIKAIDIMWQMTCGLEFLHRQKIAHGDLRLENVLFWKKNFKSKRVVVKLTGYGYTHNQSEEVLKKDGQELGWMLHAAATKQEAKPKGSITHSNLTEIDDSLKALGSELINILIDNKLKINVETLLLHPLFTQSVEEARTRLRATHCIEWNEETLNEWKEYSNPNSYDDEEFEDMKDILLSETSNINKQIDDAFKTTPKYFSEYVWHFATKATRDKNEQVMPLMSKKEMLGKGTYGKVYKNSYTDSNGKTVLAALKKCNPKPEAAAVFEVEIKTLKQLNHLFVVRYLDVIEENSKRWIVMELCEGSLKDYVKGELDRIPKDSLDDKIIVSQITLGLAYVHDQGIIHKDLKPDNILLWSHPTIQKLVLAKIADFGLAKQLKPNQADFSKTAHPGTEGYMAPELLNAASGEYPASFASDIYSLGVTIGWIVLKGIHPFNPQKIVQSVLMINGMAPPNLQNLSWDLQDLIIKLTDKDPKKRPNISLVLRHPYFILTNGRTKWQFVNELWEYFDSLRPKEREETVNEIFNSYNFHEWYDTLSGYSTPNAEDNKIMINIQQLLANLSLKDIIDHRKDYEHKLKEAIKPEYDLNIGSQINQVLLPQFNYDVNSSSYRLYKLIQFAPKLVSQYIWSRLVKIFSGQNHRQQVKMEPNNDRNNNNLRGRHRSNNSKLIKSHHIAKYQLTYTKSELEWISLFCDQQEYIDELWMIKHGSELYGTDRVMETTEMLDSLEKINVTERIWVLLLDKLEFVEPLLNASVRSHFSIAPKITEMIVRTGELSKNVVKGSKIPPPLYLAACNRSQYGADIMKVLLDNGGDPNSLDRQGFTPLHVAARNESESAPGIVKLLLEKGANPNVITSPDALTPLHYATLNGGDYAHEIMRELLNHGGSLDAIAVGKNIKMCKPIHLAVTNQGNSALHMVDLLIKNGQDVNSISGVNGMMPIHLTLYNKGTCGVNNLKKLLENGASPNVSDDLGQTPLHLAVLTKTEQAIEIMRILLENGANPNAVDNNAKTPVHFAAQNKGERAAEKLQILLTNGGNPLVKDKLQLTPFHYAASNAGACGYQIRKILPINQEDINKPIDTNGTTLLHFIVQCFDNNAIRIDNVQLVLDNGGDPNAQNDLGSSLHVAVFNDSPAALSLLELLIQKGGCPNLPHSKSLRTPVHFAALNKKERAPETMRLLLGNGGDLNAKDINQCTPLHLALTNDANDQIRLEIVAELLKQGGNPNSKDCDGETPVHYVAMKNRTNSLEMIKLLVENGGDVNAPNNANKTPLNIVEQRGYRNYCSPQVKRYIQKASRKKK